MTERWFCKAVGKRINKNMTKCWGCYYLKVSECPRYRLEECPCEQSFYDWFIENKSKRDPEPDNRGPSESENLS